MAMLSIGKPVAITVFFSCLLLHAGVVNAQSRFIVTTPADNGTGSLRSAINDANASADRSVIDFAIDPNVSGAGPWTIVLSTELPELTAPVLIRGFSQPGSRIGTTPFDHRPMIEIDDAAIPANNNDHKGTLAFVRGSEKSAVTGLSFVGGRAGDSAALLLMANGVRASANRIGIRANGTLSRFNGTAIAALCADLITIGGASAADGNWIGATDSFSIGLTGTGHVVRNNLVGFDRFGSSTFSNVIGRSGVLSGAIGYGPPPRLQTTYSPAVQATFWGLRDAVIADNRIAQTLDAAITLLGSNNPTSGNRVQRNILGRDFWNGVDAHVYAGIRLSKGALNNIVEDNLVGRANAGILLGDASNATITRAGEGNRLSRNLFFDIAYRAIGLDADNMFPVLVNDAMDADSGPNALQNKPEITAASSAGGIEGVLSAKPQAPYTIEFFLSSSCHPGGVDIAEYYLGSVDVTTDVTGRATFLTRASNIPLGGLRAGDVINATAKDAFNNTSELSACVPITAATVPNLALRAPISPSIAMVLNKLEASIQSSGARQPTGEIVFVAATATEIRTLGRATVAGGQASIMGPATGFFPQGGHYELYAEYSGDNFHLPARTAPQALTVFRPPSALLSHEYSSPLRRDLSSGDREYYETPMNTWRRLAIGSGDALVDTERFGGSFVDDLFLVRAGVYSRVDAVGTQSMLNSNRITSTTSVLDLLHLDSDLHTDAIVRDAASGSYGVVLCVFQVDVCERFEPLEVSVEYQYLLSGDLNGDGYADLVFRDPSSGNVIVMLMIAQKIHYQYLLRPKPSERVVASADINGDGYEDLIVIDAGQRLVNAWLMNQGLPAGQATALLSSSDWETPGAVHIAVKAGDPDFGIAQLVLRESSTGEAVVWRDPKIVNSVLSSTPQTLYFDPALTVERTR